MTIFVGGALPYHYRRLTPAQEQAVCAASRSGVRAVDLASMYGVGVRTIYRTIERAPRRYKDLVFGEYVATFVMDEDGPRQVTAWRPR